MLLLAGLSPAQIFTLRFIIAYVLLLVYSLTMQKGRGKSFLLFSKCWQDEVLMFALGVTGGTLYFLTENSAMNYTTTTNTSLIVSLSPLVASFLISLFFRSLRLTRIQALGSLMAALGSPLGDSLAFGAALCWGFYSMLMIPANLKYDTAFVTRKVFIYGLLAMIPYYLWKPEEATIFTSSALFSLDLSVYLNLLFLGCVASMLCFLAWNWVLKKLGAVVATNYVYFNPVTTILFAWAILSEQITIYFLLGTALILIGMYLADKKRRI